MFHKSAVSNRRWWTVYDDVDERGDSLEMDILNRCTLRLIKYYVVASKEGGREREWARTKETPVPEVVYYGVIDGKYTVVVGCVNNAMNFNMYI